MPYFDTSYLIKEAQTGEEERYTSVIWARDKEEAQRFIVERNIGEFVAWESSDDDFPYLKEEFRKDITLEIIHHTSFLSWVAIKMGKFTEDDSVGDSGILHEMIHHLCNIYPEHIEEIRNRNLLLERYEKLLKLTHTISS